MAEYLKRNNFQRSFETFVEESGAVRYFPTAYSFNNRSLEGEIRCSTRGFIREEMGDDAETTTANNQSGETNTRARGRSSFIP